MKPTQKEMIFSKTFNNFSRAKPALICGDNDDQSAENRDDADSRKSNAENSNSGEADDVEAFMPPPAPKTNRHQADKGFKFGGLALDSSSSNGEGDGASDAEQEQPNSDKQEDTNSCSRAGVQEPSSPQQQLSEENEDKVDEIITTPQAPVSRLQESKHLTASAPNLMKKPRGLVSLQIQDDNDSD